MEPRITLCHFKKRVNSVGQIQIAIRFKSRLNHLQRFDLPTRRFDLNARDFTWNRFEIYRDSI